MFGERKELEAEPLKKDDWRGPRTRKKDNAFNYCGKGRRDGGTNERNGTSGWRRMGSMQMNGSFQPPYSSY